MKRPLLSGILHQTVIHKLGNMQNMQIRRYAIMQNMQQCKICTVCKICNPRRNMDLFGWILGQLKIGDHRAKCGALAESRELVSKAL